MQISSFMLMLWAMSVLGYLYADWFHLPSFLFPLLLMIVCLVFLFAPFKYPQQIFHRNSRFWLLKHCFNCFTAPFHFVTFSDFWLGDQMNSLTYVWSIIDFKWNWFFKCFFSTCFLDFQYFVCFYATEVNYAENPLQVRTLNVTDGLIPWGYVDVNTGQDMCVSSLGMRSIVSIIPALVRFLQCLRRYRDSRAVHPHLVNMGKYATTFLVCFFGSCVNSGRGGVHFYQFYAFKTHYKEVFLFSGRCN